MALNKTIKQIDGVTTNYHRIMMIQSTINKQTSIVVFSYIDEQSRDEEKVNVDIPLYRKSKTYEIKYNPNITVDVAYAYLKTLPDFEGAEDIL